MTILCSAFSLVSDHFNIKFKSKIIMIGKKAVGMSLTCENAIYIIDLLKSVQDRESNKWLK